MMARKGTPMKRFVFCSLMAFSALTGWAQYVPGPPARLAMCLSPSLTWIPILTSASTGSQLPNPPPQSASYGFTGTVYTAIACDANGNISAGAILGQTIPTLAAGYLYSAGSSGPLSWSTSPGTGTVTSFSAGNLSPLFTTSVANSTSTPALSFNLSNAAQNSVFAGPATGGAGAPSYQSAPTISAANMTNFPTLNQNTTGTAASVAGGVLGSIPYQSAAGTTAFLAPNTSTTQEVVTETGTGSVGAAPAYLAIGTSGATIPLLSTANTWSSAQTGTSFLTTNNAIGSTGVSVGSTTAILFSNNTSYTGTKDAGIDRASAGRVEVNNGTDGNANGQMIAAAYFTTANCASGASPAVCGSAAAGAVALPTGTGSTLVVDTTAVTSASRIVLTVDASVTISGTTCNSTLATLTGTPLAITARTPGTSFTISTGAAVVISTNPVCITYMIEN